MQINGVQLAAVFNPKLVPFQDNVCKPVTIDDKASTELDVTSYNLYPVKYMPSHQVSILVNGQQQAQFVRFFSTTDLASSSSLMHKEITSQASFAKLPNGIQQYLQVAAINLESRQSLFDETV